MGLLNILRLAVDVEDTIAVPVMPSAVDEILRSAVIARAGVARRRKRRVVAEIVPDIRA